MSDFTEFTKISELLAAIVKSKEWSRRLGMHAVFDFWDDAVGGEIALKARPYLIRDGVLWVNVADSVWMQHLQFQKTLLLEKINQRLDEGEIDDIRFRLDASLNIARPGRAVRQRPVVVPGGKEMKEFEDTISFLDDEELKDAMRRLWIRSRSVER